MYKLLHNVKMRGTALVFKRIIAVEMVFFKSV
jgi:hypothetical protein